MLKYIYKGSEVMKLLLDLFLSFAKVGLFTFGGGLAMLPMLKAEVVEKKGWATEDELLDYYAVGQCTPGIIAVNTATFIGFNKKGIAGGIVATFGVVFPSVVIILLIASILAGFIDVPLVASALTGIRAVVCALMANTVIALAKKSLVDWFCAGIFIGTFVLSFVLAVPSVAIVVVAGLLGVLFSRKRGAGK